MIGREHCLGILPEMLRLRLQRCSDPDCNRLTFPPKRFCPACGNMSGQMEMGIRSRNSETDGVEKQD